jgi:N-acetylmuramoyl-L-alanine amidase
MEEKLIRVVTALVGVLAIITVTALFYLPDMHVRAEEAASQRELKNAELKDKMNGLEMLNYNTAHAKKSSTEVSFPQQLRLELPERVSKEDISIEDNYVTQTITITIPRADEEYLYDYPMIGKSNHIDNMTYESHADKGVLEISLDEVFEVKSSFEGKYLYLDFLTPQQVYDKVVVIDAGHGSNAPGAVKEGIEEKSIDLAIAMQLKAIFDADTEHKIGVYYTRTDDSNPSFDQRVQLANKSHANLFISIHNNSTKSGRFSSINGTAVMYDEQKADQERGTMHLAEICLGEVTGALGSTNKGLVPGNDIYIIRKSEVPVALIEVGFMTNQQELTNLNSQDYQKQAATGIYHAVLRAIEEGY